jgi:hypothetical protein
METSSKFVVTHQIAGINFRIESDIEIPNLLRPPFSIFQVDDRRESDIRYQIQELDPDSAQLAPLNPGERERLLRSIGFPARWLDNPILRCPEVRRKIEACLEAPEQAFIYLRWESAIIRNYASNRLDFFYPPERKNDYKDMTMMAPYRNMFATFLPNHEAVMLHSAGSIRNEVAVLFFAPDEGGKSSVIHLSPGFPILSDDHVILRRQNGSVMAHGTPFAPLTSGPIQARVGIILLLEKSSRFALFPLSRSEAVEFIWNEHMHQWITMPKNMRVRAFELIADACQQARIYRMQFPKGFVDWDAVDLAIREL